MTERYHDEWMQSALKRYLRSAMAEENITYRELSERLQTRGIVQCESTLRTKISTGIFSTSLFIHLLDVLEVEQLDVHRLMTKYQKLRNQSTKD